jgi:hypothetical protein
LCAEAFVAAAVPAAGDSFVACHDAPSIFAGQDDSSFTVDLREKDLNPIDGTTTRPVSTHGEPQPSTLTRSSRNATCCGDMPLLGL